MFILVQGKCYTSWVLGKMITGKESMWSVQVQKENQWKILLLDTGELEDGRQFFFFKVTAA